MSSSSLPPEVLGEIFVACLPQRDSHRLSMHNAPMLLCKISSSWRAVAIAEPRLWDTIIFPPSDHRQYYKFIIKGGVERWFDRTGCVWPLKFGDEPSETPSGSLITAYLHIISKYARRLTRLSLVMTKIMHLESLRRGFPQDIFDQLQSISLCCSSEMTASTLHCFPQLVTPSKTASRLKHASFTLLKADPTKFVLPWAQITSIDVASRKRPLDLAAWRDVLKACQRLQHGAFIFPWCGRRSNEPAFVHTSLKSLTLILPSQWEEVLDQIPYRPRIHSHDLEFLFSTVTFPNLQRIRFDFHAYRKPLHNVPSVCHTLGASLETVIFGWQGESDRNAPAEASAFIGKLTHEPGAFSALRHVILPCRSSKIAHMVTVLRSRPRLRVTITAVPDRIQGWTDAIEWNKHSDYIKDRIDILSTNDYHLLDIESYPDKV